MNGTKGIISTIQKKALLHTLEVDVNQVKLHVFTLQLNDGFSIGAEVEIIFKETAPLLVKGDDKVKVSAANRLTVAVEDITYGEIFAEVDLVSAIGPFTVLLTMDVIKSFDLKMGDNLLAFIKASDISIGKE
jgi:molybdopterin-binding protein